MERSILSRSSGASGWPVVLLLAGVLAGLIAGPVLAGATAPGSPTLPAAQLTGQPAEHTISVTGVGKVTVVPDQATVRLGVLVERKTAAEARDANAAAMTKVVAAIRKLGIAERDITTSMVSLGPVYDYPNNGTPKLRAYQMSNIVTVLVRDLAKLAPVLDDSVAAGATTVEGISFQVADRTAVEADAREAAVRDARARADTLAATANIRITGVASISESVVTPPWYDSGYRTAEGGAVPSTPVLPGTTDVQITVSVVYLIG